MCQDYIPASAFDATKNSKRPLIYGYPACRFFGFIIMTDEEGAEHAYQQIHAYHPVNCHGYYGWPRRHCLGNAVKITAPWTQEQVDALNRWQKSDYVHPFTCGSGRRTDADHKDGEGILIATIDGWQCPFCDYTQNWAHDFMLDVTQFEDRLKAEWS